MDIIGQADNVIVIGGRDLDRAPADRAAQIERDPHPGVRVSAVTAQDHRSSGRDKTARNRTHIVTDEQRDRSGQSRDRRVGRNHQILVQGGRVAERQKNVPSVRGHLVGEQEVALHTTHGDTVARCDRRESEAAVSEHVGQLHERTDARHIRVGNRNHRAAIAQVEVLAVTFSCFP